MVYFKYLIIKYIAQNFKKGDELEPTIIIKKSWRY
jgi:hypothetical protein